MCESRGLEGGPVCVREGQGLKGLGSIRRVARRHLGVDEVPHECESSSLRSRQFDEGHECWGSDFRQFCVGICVSILY